MADDACDVFQGLGPANDFPALGGVQLDGRPLFVGELARLRENVRWQTDFADVVHLTRKDEAPQSRRPEPHVMPDEICERGDAVDMPKRIEVVVLNLVGQVDDMRGAAAVQLRERVSHCDRVGDRGGVPRSQKFEAPRGEY